MMLKYTAFLVGARVRERDLVTERRLAAPRATGDQVERELRDPTAQHFVEAGHSRGQFANRNAVAHFLVSLGAVSSIVGQALRSTRTVKRSPMKVVMRSRKVPNSAAATSVASAGASACRHAPSFVNPSGVATSARERELRLRQLRAAHEQRLDAGGAQERGQSSVELFVDSPGGRCTLRRAAPEVALARQQPLRSFYLRGAGSTHHRPPTAIMHLSGNRTAE